MSLFESANPATATRGIHLDLKGLPPKGDRLVEMTRILRACRINCVLVEWEDAYPWHCYEQLRSLTAYSDDEVAAFLAACAEYGIEVVPLVQTFGHMQNVLVHERFAHLREVEGGTADMCPSSEGSVPLLREMIDDLLSTHTGLKRIHLGGDEVRSLGSCIDCSKAVGEIGKDGLYLRHIEPLVDYVAAKGLRPILWDDMMRRWPREALTKLGQKADLMCWAYGAQPFERVTPEIMDGYTAAGVRIWGASAFKGADGANADAPNPATRRANLDAWAAEAAPRALVGLVATGWSRYSTFEVPCDGLEASLDMLAAAGASMWDGHLDEASGDELDACFASGELAALAGDRFIACRATSRALAEWRENEWAWRHLLNQGVLAGEDERLDIAALRGACTRLRSYIARGSELCEAWKSAHAGLVDDVWLDRYCASRVYFATSVLAPWLETIEKRIAAAQ